MDLLSTGPCGEIVNCRNDALVAIRCRCWRARYDHFTYILADPGQMRARLFVNSRKTGLCASFSITHDADLREFAIGIANHQRPAAITLTRIFASLWKAGAYLRGNQVVVALFARVETDNRHGDLHQ